MPSQYLRFFLWFASRISIRLWKSIVRWPCGSALTPPPRGIRVKVSAAPWKPRLTSEQAALPCSFLFTFGAFSFALKPPSHLPACLLASASRLSPEPAASWTAGPVGVSSSHTGVLRALGGRFLWPSEGRGHSGPLGCPKNQPVSI